MASISSQLFVALCSALLVVCLATPTSRILAGDEAGPDVFPWLVSVRLDDAHVCGGSVVAANYILTAAHCVSEVATSAVASNRVSIRAGSTNQYAGGKIVNVGSITIHNLYGNFLYDLALLRLVSNLELGARVKIVELADSSNDVVPGDNVTVAGWGRTVTGGSNAFKLQSGTATTISRNDCDDSIGYGYDTTLCVQNEPGEGACNGDAGGPIMFNNLQVGVLNFVIGACGTKYPDVGARVSYFSSWIDTIINAA